MGGYRLGDTVFLTGIITITSTSSPLPLSYYSICISQSHKLAITFNLKKMRVGDHGYRWFKARIFSPLEDHQEVRIARLLLLCECIILWKEKLFTVAVMWWKSSSPEPECSRISHWSIHITVAIDRWQTSWLFNTHIIAHFCAYHSVLLIISGRAHRCTFLHALRRLWRVVCKKMSRTRSTRKHAIWPVHH
jgi:hypothetical protein